MSFESGIESVEDGRQTDTLRGCSTGDVGAVATAGCETVALVLGSGVAAAWGVPRGAWCGWPAMEPVGKGQRVRDCEWG